MRRAAPILLVGVKALHTAVWFSVESALVVVLVDGLRGRRGRRTALAAAVVGAESAVFLGNGARCPMTTWAEALGATRGSVTDIFLPRWFARSLPAIHVPLVGLALWLHLRRRPRLTDGPGRWSAGGPPQADGLLSPAG